MKKFTKKSFLNEIKKQCEFSNVLFLSYTSLHTNWWLAIVQVDTEYRVYKSCLDWIDEIYRIDFIKNLHKHPLQIAMNKVKENL